MVLTHDVTDRGKIIHKFNNKYLILRYQLFTTKIMLYLWIEWLNATNNAFFISVKFKMNTDGQLRAVVLPGPPVGSHSGQKLYDAGKIIAWKH